MEIHIANLEKRNKKLMSHSEAQPKNLVTKTRSYSRDPTISLCSTQDYRTPKKDKTVSFFSFLS